MVDKYLFEESSASIPPWGCRIIVFCKHPRNPLTNKQFSTDLNKTYAIQKVIKFARMYFLGFSTSVQVLLQSVN